MSPTEPSFFVTGGTVPLAAASYLERSADRELLETLLAGEYCFVLNARQMGKSSLSVRAMSRLTEEGIRAVFMDLDDGPSDIFCGFDSRLLDLPFHHLSAADWATYDQTLEIDCTQETAATVVVRIRGIP